MNMRRIGANLSVNMREYYRNKATMFFTILFPVMLMVLFGFIFQDAGSTVYDLPIQDKDGGVWSQNFTEILETTELFNIIEVSPDADIDQYIIDNKPNVIMVIPEGYSDGINQTMAARFMGLPVNDTVNLTVMYDPSVQVAGAKMQILNSIIQGLNKGLSGAQDTIGMTTQTTVSDQFEFIDFFTPGIIAMSVMTTSLFGTVGMNTELKQKGILRKLATTPLTRPEWLVSNILYQLIMAAISTTAILLVGMGLFGLTFELNLFLPLFILLNVFAFSGIGMLITRFVDEAESANAAANAVMFPMMFLSGTFFPLEQMPDFLKTVAQVLPLYYVNEGLRAAMISMDFTKVWFNAAVIGIFGIVVFILGIFVTSWKDE